LFDIPGENEVNLTKLWLRFLSLRHENSALFIVSGWTYSDNAVVNN